MMGVNTSGQSGLNDVVNRSSPTQVPGTTWAVVANVQVATIATKTDGTLWSWGNGGDGRLGQNTAPTIDISSPVQVPGTTWGTTFGKLGTAQKHTLAIKTDGTLWAWGYNGEYGQLGQNQPNNSDRSSPVQIPGTTWARVMKSGGSGASAAIKTDGTLWTWGLNQYGQLGLNDKTHRSSPTQVPGTTWANFYSSHWNTLATKTDGTLWAMGGGQYGALGQNSQVAYSSPVQIPGTWGTDYNSFTINSEVIGKKSDGTLWGWGGNNIGQLAQNSTSVGNYSSPIQILGSGWQEVSYGDGGVIAIRNA